MSAFRLSMPHVVACAALALPIMSGTSFAKDPAADLDTLAYGSLGQAASSDTIEPAARRQVPSSQSRQSGLLSLMGFATPQSPARASVPMRPMPAYSGGLLSAIGLDGAARSAPRAVVRAPIPVLEEVVVVPAAPPAVIVAAPPVIVAAPRLTPAPAPMPPLQANAQIPVAYPSPVVATREFDYRIDAGDKLRVVVYGQEGLTNSYAIDAGGGLTMPLIGRVEARGMTPVGLAAHITARLRKGYIREPSVAVEIESYRPFFILGEVAAPGQYPYVPNMSVEAAVAIAGGFSPRARRDSVVVTHQAGGGQLRAAVPLGTPLNPGDTITVGERWF